MSFDERELAAEFQPRVLYFALRRLRNRSFAEEVAQQTILILIGALREEKIEDQAKIGSFIFGIANNLILKQRAKSAALETDIRVESVAEEIPWHQDPEAAILLKEKRLQLRQAMAELTEDERTLLIESSQEHGSGTTVATRLGITPATLRKRKSRIIARLRESIKEVTNSKNLTPT